MSPSPLDKIDWRSIPFATLGVAFTAWGLSNMDQSLFGYAVPDLMGAFKMSLNAVSLIISASFAFGIVASIAIGVLTDSWGAKRTLPLCLGISALLVGLQAFAPSALVFGCLRVGSAGFSAALAPITNAMVAGRAPPRLRAILLAVLQCAYPLGWFIASVFAAPIMAHTGWRPAFMVAFVVIPVAVILYLFIPTSLGARAPETPPVGQPKFAGGLAAPLKAVFGPQYRWITIFSGAAFLLYGGAVGGSAFFMPTFFHAVRGYTSGEAARIVGASYGIGIFGYIAAALVSDSLMTRRDTAVTWVWLGGLAFLASLWLPKTVTADIAVFGLTTFFFYGASAILLIYLMELFPRELRATAGAVSGTAAISAGFMIFPILTVAAVGRVGWSLGMSVVIVPALLVSGASLMLLPRRVASEPNTLPAVKPSMSAA
jgi:AAHS family benzoate transporter-like MFS transporter